MSARPTAQSKSRRPDASRQRIIFVVALLVLWMSVIGGRLVYLQHYQYDQLSARARRQQQRQFDSTPQRGLILDREGRELARSLEVDSFFVVPGEMSNVDATAQRLAHVLGTNAGELAVRLQKARSANRDFVWIARQVDAEQAARVRALNLACVHARKESKRYYPNGALASHVLGFVGRDDAGLAGVERFQNVVLNGASGKTLNDHDGRGQAFDSFEITPHAGQSVTLTIDQNIQYQTEQTLLAAVAQAHAKSGTAVVLDPRTGEILALANAPTFDPNDPARAQAAALDVGADAATSTVNVLKNHALQDVYEPGSTFKVVAYSGALEEKLARPTDLIDCQMGAITVAGRVVHDSHPHGTLTITDALAQSSNVAAIKLGLRLGNERFYQYMRRFGFGQRTGVELPGETPGLLRPVARWQPTSMGSLPIGQEVAVTPVQMAAAFAAIANDGVRIAPHLVREIRDEAGTVAARAAPESHRVVSVETARTLKPMLESVTLKGTAKAAQLNGYTAAGKTGTAQKIDPKTRAYSKTKYVASFVGFAPVENPSVVIVVVIDEPIGSYYGGAVAAPVFRDIAESVLPYLNIAPDAELESATHAQIAQGGDEAAATDSAQPQSALAADDQADANAGLPKVDPTSRQGDDGGGEVVYALAGERALLMPDVRGRSVRDAMRVCSHLGLELEARGEGRAVRQTPIAGTQIESGQTVRIEFARSD